MNIELTDEQANLLGERLAKVLRLRKKDGRFNLSDEYGTKTNSGLARVVVREILKSIQE